VTAVAVITEGRERDFTGTIVASCFPEEEDKNVEGRFSARQRDLPGTNSFAFRYTEAGSESWTVLQSTDLDRQGVAAIIKNRKLRGINRIQALGDFANPGSSVIWKIIEVDCESLSGSEVFAAGSKLDVDVVKERIKALPKCDFAVRYPLLLLAAHKEELSLLRSQMDDAVKEECCDVQHILAVIAAGGESELDRLLKDKLPKLKTESSGGRGQFNQVALFGAIKESHNSGFISSRCFQATMLQYCNYEEYRDLAILALADMKAWDVAETLVLKHPGKWNASSEISLAFYLKSMEEASRKAGKQELAVDAARLLKKVRDRSPQAVRDAEEFWDAVQKEQMER